MKTYKAGELREDMLVVPVHMLEAGREELARLRADSAELARLRMVVEDERSSFEEFHRKRCIELGMDQADIDSEFDRDADGEYIYIMAIDGWKAWEERVNRATAKIPEGFALVPVEPTPEMLEAGSFSNPNANRLVYKAMLAAAPKGDSHE